MPATMPDSHHEEEPTVAVGGLWEIALTMGRLGCLAFGGPVAHLAHFRRELVERRRWLSEQDFVDLVAFCQFLPGPASSQVGMGLGLARGGLPGMFIAWLCFTMPSVLLLLAAAAGLGALSGLSTGWLHGLLAGVVAIVADAVLKMGATCCPSRSTLSIAVIATVILIVLPTAWMQMLVIAGGALIGLLFLRPVMPPETGGGRRFGRGVMGTGWIILLLLVLVPVLASLALGRSEPTALAVYGAFAQTGSLVFGGGHVVLPLLQADVVGPGWLSDEQFLAGYGVTQAMPGPIFTLSAFLGATAGANLHGGWLPFFTLGGIALIGIFMPSFGFVCALYPVWDRLRRVLLMRRALQGINAAVVGLLVAALYDPVWTKAMAVPNQAAALSIALASWLLLTTWKLPAWLVLALAATTGALINL